MRVRMLKSVKGSEDGIKVVDFEKGKEYDINSEGLLEIFLKEKYAELVKVEAEDEEKHEDKEHQKQQKRKKRETNKR